MRERWALALAVLTGLLVVLGSVAFSLVRNAGDSAVGMKAAPAQGSPGRAVFEAQGCLGCHSVAGKGSPRSPLDGVGARLSRQQLSEWAIGAASVADNLSPRALQAKRANAQLPREDMDALLDYLESLR